MHQMVAPDDVDEEMYIRHLALFVSWVLPIILTINSCSPLFYRESLHDYQKMIKQLHVKCLGSGWEKIELFLRRNGRY